MDLHNPSSPKLAGQDNGSFSMRSPFVHNMPLPTLTEGQVSGLVSPFSRDALEQQDAEKRRRSSPLTPPSEPLLWSQSVASKNTSSTRSRSPTSKDPRKQRSKSHIIFPVPPSPQFSRAADLSARLSHSRNTEIIDQVKGACGEERLQEVVTALGTVEREEMDDLALLEHVAQKMGLVDLDHACSGSTGFEERSRAEDQVLLDTDGYERRWEAFEALCLALGLEMRDVCEAKRRCGPPGMACSLPRPTLEGR